VIINTLKVRKHNLSETVQIELPRGSKILGVNWDDSLFERGILISYSCNDDFASLHTTKLKIIQEGQHYHICDIGAYIGKAGEYHVFYA